MTLIEIFNKITKREVGTFIVCQDHLDELKTKHHPSIHNFRELTRNFTSECQMCAGKTTSITFEKTPENICLFVIFDNDETENGWSAYGHVGHLKYITDNNGNIYNTKESLYRRGVRKIYIQTGFELNIDKEPLDA